MKTNRILQLAIAAAFAGASATSFAALTVPASPGVKTASEQPIDGVTLTGGANQFQIGSKATNFAPSAGQNLQVSVTIDNGAKFLAAPVMNCHVFDAGASALAAGTLNLGGAGSNNAVFTLQQSNVTGALGNAGGSGTVAGASGCFISGATLTVTGAHTNVNATITYTYGTLASSVESGPVIAWTKGVDGAISAAAAGVTALVTSGFLNIAGGVGGGLTMSAGTVYLAGNGTPAATIGTAMSAGEAVVSASISVNGNPLAATTAANGVFLVTAGVGCTAAAAVYKQVSGAKNSVTFTGLTTDMLSAGVDVCLTFTGKTAIPDGPITASISATPTAKWTVNTATTNTNLASVSRNGSSTRAMNIPAVTNADQAFIRVTNTSAIAGKLYGTMYDQSGAVLGTANSLLADAATFVSNATLAFDVAALKTSLGITTDWTGRAQLVLTAETTAMRAQNLIRVSNGTLVNVGGDTSTGNN